MTSLDAGLASLWPFASRSNSTETNKEAADFSILTKAQLIDSRSDDDEQGQQFGVGEHVLDASGPLDVPAVDKRQETFNCNEMINSENKRETDREKN